MVEVVGADISQTRDDRTHPFRVLATSPVFAPGFRYGGPVRSLARIVETVSDRIDLALVTRDRDLGSSSPYPGLSGHWVRRTGSRVFYLNPFSPRHWLRLWRELRRAPFDLLYVNSHFSAFSIVPIVAAKLGVIRVRQVLVAPRGELSPGSLSLKRRKKQLFLRLWMPLLGRMGIIWHASTEREAAAIRSVCPWARVEVNQGQVALPLEPLPAEVEHDGPVRLVFISRISASKNLELVLRALQDTSTLLEFDIYGPLEDPGYWAKCRSLLAELPPTVRARYCGELDPEEVRHTFVKYDAFVFPTLGESFGHVIAESLSASCPVICSDETPWTDVLAAGGGAVVRHLTARHLAEQLDRFGAMDQADRLRARRVAADAYRSWRRRIDGSNILEQVRLAPWAVRR